MGVGVDVVHMGVGVGVGVDALQDAVENFKDSKSKASDAPSRT